MRIFVDSDACPVKDEVVRVAERHGLSVVFIGNRWLRGLDHPLISQMVAGEGLDKADDLIVEHIGMGDIVITADVPLAARCLEMGARGMDHRGRVFDGNSIGMAVATRDLMTQLREVGQVTSGPAGYTKQDRSRFLDRLERLIQTMSG